MAFRLTAVRNKMMRYCKVLLLILMVISLGIFVFGNIDTNYASGYTRHGFNKITVGMTKEDVKSLIGSPLEVSHITFRPERYEDGTTEIWIYSTQGDNKSANFFGRYVFFNSDGEVVNKEDGYMSISIFSHEMKSGCRLKK